MQKSFHQAQAEISVSFDLVVAAEAAENLVTRFLLTCENSNNLVPMNRLMETCVATGA